MTEQEEIKELVKKRGSYKGRLTVFSTYLSGLDKTLSPSQVCELQLRINKLEAVYDQYDEVQLRLECICDDDKAQISERKDFENIYYKCLAEAQCKISLSTMNNDNSSEKGSSRTNTRNLIKLPTIQLPKFSGSYENWLEFHDTFNSLIHSNNDIDNINKFHYLRASLEGTAALVIQSIEFSSNNYNVAWNLLCERFDNKRLLIQNHVSALFNVEPITKESSHSIKRLIDQINKNLRALESLNEPTKHWDTLLIHMITQKLDVHTYREWEELKGRLGKDKPTLTKFLEFLCSRADLLETLELSRGNSRTVNSNKSNQKLKSMVSVTNENQHSSSNVSMPMKPCPKCNGEHGLQNCPQFLALSNEDRWQLLPKYKVCFNCFKAGHYANHCKKIGCKVCKRKHNSLIHVTDPKTRPHTFSSNSGPEKPLTPVDELSSAAVTLSCMATSRSGTDVLLSTALIKLYDADNRQHIARAVLDSGSTSCLMTETLCKKLNLPAHNVEKSLLGINNSLSNIGKMVQVPMKSLDENYCNTLQCFVLPTITDNVPSRQINLSILNIPTDICLADPNFYIPSAVDLIIGADVFWDLLGSRRIKLTDGSPILYETRLGWIVSGPIGSDHVSNSSRTILCNFSQTESCNDNKLFNDDIQTQLTRFWQLEEEQMCENHFNDNTTRLKDGRFCVRIPLKQSEDVLGDSLQRAKHCLLSLERRTKSQPTFSNNYREFMSEYLSLGHMSECDFNPCRLAYFIPHHGVIREMSTTTKLRVVFNASAPTTSGVSLNNIQMVGPTIQDDLLSILLRFRQHKYILAGDVEKMYRQVVVHPSDRHLQQILWRDSPSDPIKTFQLNTVTYGTASAPFLAIRCLKQVGLDCDDPAIAQIIIHDFYVDDLLSGGDTIAKVQDIKEKVTLALASACMPLRKFKSNAPELMSDSQSSVDLNIGAKEPSKTLGLDWHTGSDELCFKINAEPSNVITKRSILSLIGQIFDPLGLLSPCVISLKMIMQKLWLCKVSWDEELPPEITQLWCKLIKDLPLLNEVRIPRLVLY
ncbi:hypothetical protein ABMA27_009990 [Loxostege sticticalis]|uniref:CCHC-type domain-containing protein n=1 Tax=Loxostege sticticalis TaxID=481309 RepID=A0ABR3H7P4_LOXSC